MTLPVTHLICFSQLRWNFVYQRPQHLLSRFSAQFPVYYVEEPIFDADDDYLEIRSEGEHLSIVVPHLREDVREDEGIASQKDMLSRLFIDRSITRYIFWYYSPGMFEISDQFNPILTVYDCMEEPSAVKYAAPSIKEFENALMAKADIVFTSGYSLYEAKKHRHHEVHPFPSSIDTEHYFKARLHTLDVEDQAAIPRPRIGYFGVIDERMDLTLIQGIARRKPEWQLIMIGPVARMNPESLPQLPNIHYLGMKAYADLPSYIAGWDLAMVPFAHNEATRYISPTQTPEYLAAGKPVISTPIIDVLRQYGRTGLVNIAGTVEEFVRVASIELENADKEEWLQRVNEFLSVNSWDKTWHRMMYLITRKLNDKEKRLARQEILAS